MHPRSQSFFVRDSFILNYLTPLLDHVDVESKLIHTSPITIVISGLKTCNPSMENAAKAELVRKAMRDAGLGANMVSAFNEDHLLKLHTEGYRLPITFQCARERDLSACGIR